MNRRAIILCFVFTIITVLLLFLNNQEYSVEESSVELVESNEVFESEFFFEEQNLWNHFDHPMAVLIILGAFSFPFLLIFESTFFPGVRKGWWRLIFLAQAVLFFYLAFLVWFIMVFKIFVEINVFIPYYLILIYLGFGVLWNLLLSLPYTDNIKFIQKSFEILSLKQKKTNE